MISTAIVTMPPMLCGPHHRERGGTGLPTGATPSHKHIDDQGGFWIGCVDCKHYVHVDSNGEPFDPERYAEIKAARGQWKDLPANHSMGSFVTKVVSK